MLMFQFSMALDSLWSDTVYRLIWFHILIEILVILEVQQCKISEHGRWLSVGRKNDVLVRVSWSNITSVTGNYLTCSLWRRLIYSARCLRLRTLGGPKKVGHYIWLSISLKRLNWFVIFGTLQHCFVLNTSANSILNKFITHATKSTTQFSTCKIKRDHCIQMPMCSKYPHHCAKFLAQPECAVPIFTKFYWPR